MCGSGVAPGSTQSLGMINERGTEAENKHGGPNINGMGWRHRDLVL